MPRSQEVEERIRRIIRDAVAVDPMISLRALQQVLERRQYPVGDLNYINKLRRKVHREALEEMNRQSVAERLTETRERFRIIISKLERIAYWSPETATPGEPPPSAKDQIAALKAIFQMDVALFKAQIDAGLFVRQLELIESEKRFIPLAPELKEQIIRSFRHYVPELPASASHEKADQN